MVSLTGYGFGLLGSTLIALAWLITAESSIIGFIIITICGMLGNMMDSLLGLVWQRKGFLNNHQVNAMATTFGAILSGILAIYNF